MNRIDDSETNYKQLELLEAIEKDMGMVPDFSWLRVHSPFLLHILLGLDGHSNDRAFNSQPYIDMDFQTISLHFTV